MDNEEKQRKADIALKNRLFVSGWELSYILQVIRKGKFTYNYEIELYYKDDQPVGVATYNIGTKEIAVFVRKAYRLQGIGRELCKQLKTDVIIHDSGIDGSGTFFRKVFDL